MTSFRLELAALVALVACWVAWVRFMNERENKKGPHCV